jgi:hypothetical protein
MEYCFKNHHYFWGYEKIFLPHNLKAHSCPALRYRLGLNLCGKAENTGQADRFWLKESRITLTVKCNAEKEITHATHLCK